MKQWLQSQKEYIDSYFVRPRQVAWLYALAIFLGLFVSWWYVGAVIEKRLAHDERVQVAAQVDRIGSSLTLAINQRLVLVTSVRSFIETVIISHNDFSVTEANNLNELNSFSNNLYESVAGIRNIAIAPNGVMKYVYPYEENKSVLGYEPARDERVYVREEVQRTIGSGEIILSLPYELIQGGQGLIARQAIYIDEDYWGLANVVLDVPPLLEESGISPLPVGLNLALKNQSGQVFFGSEDVFNSAPVSYKVKLPEGSWELAGLPSVGWQTGFQTTLLFYRWMGLTGIIAISLLVYQLINRRDRLANLVELRTHELALSNQTLITVLEGIDADVYVSEFETNKVLFANKHIRDSFNNELIGKTCFEVFRAELSVCANCKSRLLFDADGRPTGVYLWEDRNPITDRWYKNADRAIRWQDGHFVHLQIATDISEQKQAVEAIRDSEERYRNLFDSLPVGVYRSTPEGRFLDGNPALMEMLGYPDQETMFAANIKDLYIKESSREQELALIEQNDYVGNYCMKLRRHDGSIIWVQDSSNVVRDSSGNTVHYYGLLEDITERVRAEEAARAYQDRFRVFFNSVNDAIFVHPLLEEGFSPFIEVNDIACQRYGYSRDEFLKLTAFDVTQKSDVEGHSAPGNRKKLLKAQHLVFETVHIKKTGEVFPVEINANIVEEYGRPVILAVVRDVTQRKKSEQALQEREAELQSIFRAAPVGIGMVVNREIREANQMLCGMTGYSREELVGEDARLLYPSEDDYQFVGSEKYRQIKEQGIGSVETRWQCKSGEIRDVLLSSVPLDFDDFSKGVTFSALDITERKRAESALLMKTGELETLFSISKHLRAARSAEEMLPLVVGEMRNVLEVDASLIILLDPGGQNFRYAFGDGALAPNAGEKFTVEKSISGLVLKTRQPYVTKDFSSDPHKNTNLKGAEGLGPAAVVPLQSEEEFLGVLVCARNKERNAIQFSTSEVQLLTAIGEMVGNALRRAGLYDQALMRLQNVQALRSIDMAISANMELSVVLEVLLAQGVAQLDVDAASVLLLDPHTHTLEFEAGYGFRTKEVESVILRIGEGLPGQVALKREILHVPDLLGSETLLRKIILREGFVSYHAAPLMAKGQLQGVLETFTRTSIVMDDEKIGFLEALATQAAIAIDNARLFINLQRSNFELETAYDATIEGWSRALELRDQETEGHTLRVADLTVRLAQAMGVRSEEIVHIRRGALLHDIGKMGVPDHILLKPGKLDDDEWEIMKQHASYAFEMLRPIEFLRPALDISRYHHEKWDGTGYPRGLKGEQIPFSARIFAVVDVWDALNSDRPYREAWTEEKALEYITTSAGKHFDPQVVEAFLDLRNKSGKI